MQKSFGTHLSVKGNIVILTHYPEEYEYLCSVRDKICEEASVEGQKYYPLKEPITIAGTTTTPEATYTHLYIRKPDPYRSQVGDLDFNISEKEYRGAKIKAGSGNLQHARIFPEDRLDMIELHHPDSDVLAYVSSTSVDDVVKITKSGI